MTCETKMLPAVVLDCSYEFVVAYAHIESGCRNDEANFRVDLGETVCSSCRCVIVRGEPQHCWPMQRYLMECACLAPTLHEPCTL